MEIVEYRRLQAAAEKEKEEEKKEAAAKAQLDAHVEAEKKELSELAKGPPVIGKVIK